MLMVAVVQDPGRVALDLSSLSLWISAGKANQKMMFLGDFLWGFDELDCPQTLVKNVITGAKY